MANLWQHKDAKLQDLYEIASYRRKSFFIYRDKEENMSDYSYELIKKGLDVSSMRQKNISSNISNINTPNYKANKIKFEEYLDDAGKLRLEKNHKDHYGIKSIEDLKPEVVKRMDNSLSQNENNVDIDLEMTELAANEIYYNVLIRQISSKLSNLNYVINK